VIERMARKRRQDRILLGGLLALAALLLVLGTAYWRRFAAEQRAETRARLAAATALKAEELEHYRRERIADAATFFENANFADLTGELRRSPNAPVLRRRALIWLERARASQDYDRVYLLTPEGTELLGTPPPPLPPDRDLLPDIGRALRARRPLFADLYRDRDDGRVYLTVLVPISPPVGGPAVLALRIDPERNIYPYLERRHLPASSLRTLLVRREGDRAVLLNEPPAHRTPPLFTGLPLSRDVSVPARAARGERGILEGPDTRGIPVIACVRPVRDSPWLLVTQIDREEVEAPLRARARELLLVCALALVGVALGLGWLRRSERLRFYRERYEASLVLQEREEFLNAILDRLADPLCVKDEEHRWVQVNEKFCELVGHPREELIGRSDPDYLPPAQAEIFRRVDREVLETGRERANEEYLTNDATGETRFLHTKKSLYRDREGRRFVIAIGRDMTEQRRMTEELLLNRQRLELSQAIGKTGSWEYDLPTGRLWGSDGAIRLFGIDPATTDRGYLEVDRIEGRILDRERIHQALVDLVERGLPYDLEYRVLTAPGEEPRVLHSQARALRDEEGEIRRVVGVIRDVTERRRIEEALRESEAKLRRAEEIGRLGHTSVDLRTGRCVWSEELYRIFGVPPEEGPLCADAERLRRLVHPEDRESLDRQMAAALAGEGQTLEYRILRPDGEIRHATATLEVQRDEAGHPLSLFATVQDTTELKRRERELREKNAELERFTYTISHDLKSPLVTVKTFLGYLEEDLRGPDPERVLQDLRYIRTAADKMSRLLDELLEMSRAGRTLSPPTRAPFRELVREALEAVAGRLAERGVQVRVATDPTVLFGDRPRLTAIWQNLIENAAKYMGDQADPVVEIEAEGSGREKVFTVRDNGMGIDPRYRGKIFGLFEKLDPRSEGTGFGLALVRRIVEYYGGTIEVESPGEGGGSLFRFTLPGAIREEDNPEAPPGTGEMEPLWPEAEEAGARGNGVWGVVSAEPEAGSGDARKADGRERTR